MAETDSTLGPAGKLENAQDVKKKQMALLAVIGIVVLASVFLSVLLQDNKPSAREGGVKSGPTTKTNVALPGTQVDARELWVSNAGLQITALEKDKKELEERIKKLESFAQKAAATQDKLPALPPLPPAPPLPATPPGPNPASNNAAIPLQGEGQDARAAEQGVPGAHIIASTQVSNSSSAAASPATEASAAKVGVMAGTVAGKSAATPAQLGAAPTGSRAKNVTRDDYLPSGTFVQAVLLSGLDAPTGGQAQSNPHPVLLRLHDNAILPNRFRGQVKECFIVAAGYGDLSSERAYLRTESLSCVNHKGEAVDVGISGWAIGDDGKAGIRGRLISKQGQAMATAILTATLSGVGMAIKESATITYTSELGTTQVPRPGAEFRAGMGAGIAKGVDRLTDYYVRLAERMFPVIEVDAGRVVDIALNKGISLGGLFSATGSTSLAAGGHTALIQRQQMEGAINRSVADSAQEDAQ